MKIYVVVGVYSGEIFGVYASRASAENRQRALDASGQLQGPIQSTLVEEHSVQP